MWNVCPLQLNSLKKRNLSNAGVKHLVQKSRWKNTSLHLWDVKLSRVNKTCC